MVRTFDINNYMPDLEFAGTFTGSFPGDHLSMLQANLLQLLPLAKLQLDRIEETIPRTGKKTIESTVLLIDLLGDVRFYYETLYWIALAVRKAGLSSLRRDTNSLFGNLYKTSLKQVATSLETGRITLSHIQLDEIIVADSLQDYERISSHMPNHEKLLQKITVGKDGKSIDVSGKQLNFHDDYNRLIELKEIISSFKTPEK